MTEALTKEVLRIALSDQTKGKLLVAVEEFPGMESCDNATLHLRDRRRLFEELSHVEAMLICNHRRSKLPWDRERVHGFAHLGRVSEHDFEGNNIRIRGEKK